MKKMLFIYIILCITLISCFDGLSSDALNEAYETKSGINMIYVPAGTFQRDALAANTSYVSAFYIAPHEVTRAQFLSVMGYDPSDQVASPTIDSPVQKVNWYHTLVYCNRLSMREGLSPVYIINGSTNPDFWGAVPVVDNPIWNAAICNMYANGYRLPTEMEWRWAAMGAIYDQRSGDIVSGINRGGYTKAYSGSIEPGVANAANYAWYYHAGYNHSVGTKLPNELGIYDMSGNVWEWCWDWWYSPLNGAFYNYTGAASGPDKIYLGGCYDDATNEFNVGYRINVHQGPILNAGQVGFRLVRSAVGI